MLVVSSLITEVYIQIRVEVCINQQKSPKISSQNSHNVTNTCRRASTYFPALVLHVLTEIFGDVFIVGSISAIRAKRVPTPVPGSNSG